jgi:MAP3K TRAFs-binding domain
MPFGQKRDVTGTLINFDSIYKELIAPSIEEAGLEPLRADEEMTGGIIHRPMFERLILCEYAVADLTTANANVFYQLGVRYAIRPWSTILIYAESGGRLPFDLSPIRAMPYRINLEKGAIEDGNVEDTKASLIKRLEEAKKAQSTAIDSPLFQLFEGYPNVDDAKTDVFRDRVAYSTQMKQKLAVARKQGIEAIRALEKQELEDIRDLEAGVIIDLFLSYRVVRGWQDMINLADRMPPPLAATAMIQEQLALALNRQASKMNELEKSILRERAEKILLDLLKKRGPYPETYGILGIIYKDWWEQAIKAHDDFASPELLKKAIEAYLHGFEADWRNPYPGINAVTLMEIEDPPDPRRNELLYVVSYAVQINHYLVVLLRLTELQSSLAREAEEATFFISKGSAANHMEFEKLRETQ